MGSPRRPHQKVGNLKRLVYMVFSLSWFMFSREDSALAEWTRWLKNLILQNLISINPSVASVDISSAWYPWVYIHHCSVSSEGKYFVFCQGVFTGWEGTLGTLGSLTLADLKFQPLCQFSALPSTSDSPIFQGLGERTGFLLDLLLPL